MLFLPVNWLIASGVRRARWRARAHQEGYAIVAVKFPDFQRSMAGVTAMDQISTSCVAERSTSVAWWRADVRSRKQLQQAGIV
jgi:hypothetical protein